MKFSINSLIASLTAVFIVFCLGFLTARTLAGPEIVLKEYEYATELSEESAGSVVSDPNASPFPIDINTAGVYELMQIPGIGETYARRIVEYRDQYGPFEKVTDLLNISGIGEKRFEAILEYITVGG